MDLACATTTTTPTPGMRPASYSERTTPTSEQLRRSFSELDVDDSEYSTLRIWLQGRGLGRYFLPLRSLGAKKVSDLALLTQEDLNEMNIDPRAARTLKLLVVA